MTEQKGEQKGEQKTELTREELLDIVEAQKIAISELKAVNAAEREKLFKSFLCADNVEADDSEVPDANDNDDWSKDIEKMEQRLINKFKGR